MIPAIAYIVAVYAIARLIQVPLEMFADPRKREGWQAGIVALVSIFAGLLIVALAVVIAASEVRTIQ